MPLKANRSTVRMGDRAIPDYLYLPVDANKLIYQGALVVLAAGLAQPGSSALNLIAVGCAQDTADNTGGLLGAISVPVRQGTFKWANGPAADLIAVPNVGSDCFVIDDQTVGLTNGGGTRSRAGKVIQVDPDGVWVQIAIGL